MRTRRRRFALGLALVVGLMWVGAGSAAAHAIVVEIDPADGSVVAAAPSVVTVRFTESVTLADRGNRVIDATTAEVSLGVEVVGDEVRYALPADLADGTYVVTWQVVSADSHPVVGSSVFHVGAPSADSADVAGLASVAAAPAGIGVWRALSSAVMYAAALVAVGAAWFARRWPPAVAERVGRVAAVAATIGVASVVAVAAFRAVELTGRWPALGDPGAVREVLRGPIAWSLLAVTMAMGGVLLALQVRRLGALVLFAGAAALVAGAAVEGHTRSATPRWLVVAADIGHVGAAAVWLGGVAALVVGWSVCNTAERRRIVVDVSSHAVVAVCMVAGAGLAMAATIADGASAVTSTTWGRGILVKLAAVVALAVLGWVNRFRLLPRLAAPAPGNEGAVPRDAASASDARVMRAFRRTLGAELVLFAIAAVATGVVVSSSPVTGATAAAAADDRPASVLATIPLRTGIGSVIYDLRPVRVGDNELVIEVLDPAGAPLETIFDPVVELRERTAGVGPITLEPEALGPGRYRVPLEVPFAGKWSIMVIARVGTFTSGEAVLTVAFD